MLVNPCGKPWLHPDPLTKLATPTKARLFLSMSGPPESPKHTLCFSFPLAQITLFLNIKNGKLSWHRSQDVIVKFACCKIGAMVLSVVFKTPFPIATTFKFPRALCANFTG